MGEVKFELKPGDPLAAELIREYALRLRIKAEREMRADLTKARELGSLSFETAAEHWKGLVASVQKRVEELRALADMFESVVKEG